MYWNMYLKKILMHGWLYLTQPLFNSETKVILNPFKFSHTAKIQILEKCWELDNTPGDRHHTKNHKVD